MKQRVKSQTNLNHLDYQTTDFASPTQSSANYKVIVRKPATKQIDFNRRSQIQTNMDIRYYAPKITYEQVLQYLKNMKFTTTTPRKQKQNLQMCSVTSLKIDGDIYPTNLTLRVSQFNQDDQIYQPLQQRRNSGNYMPQTSRNSKERKTYRENTKDYQKSHKQIKSNNKIKFVQEDLRQQIRKNNELEETVKMQDNKILYLEKQLQLRAELLSKNGKKADKSHVDQLRYRNNQLQTENRQIKSMLQRVTQSLKYYQIQTMMLRKKKHDTINLQMKCLKLNQKNRYLQQKLQKYNNNTKSSNKLNHNQSQKILKSQIIEHGQNQLLFNLTPQISPDVIAQKPNSSFLKKIKNE